MDNDSSLTERTTALIIRIVRASIHIPKVVAIAFAISMNWISNSLMRLVIYWIIYDFTIGFFISRNTEAATAK